MVQWVKKAREDFAVTLVQLVLLAQLEKEVLQAIAVFQVKMDYLVKRVPKDSAVSQARQAPKELLVILVVLVIVVSREQGALQEIRESQVQRANLELRVHPGRMDTQDHLVHLE